MFGVNISDNNNNNNNKLLSNSSIIQIFVSSKNLLDISKIYDGKYIVHASYTINIAKMWDKYSPHVLQFISEIQMAHTLNALGIVIHLGKQLDLSLQDAYNNMLSVLLYIHEQTANIPIDIYIETSTGQGSEMCNKIEDLAYFYKKIIRHKNKAFSKRFKLCLDTCHIFNAGYDITSKNKILDFLDIFEELIGIRYIALIHLNDAKNKMGSNIDRHENISTGFGHIGKSGIKFIARYFNKLNIPIILETPYENLLDDLKYLNHILIKQ